MQQLTGLLVFAMLLAWPGLPLKQCARVSMAHECCAPKKTSCGCESKSKPKLCNCSHHSSSEVTLTTPATPLAVVLQVSLVLEFLQAEPAGNRAVVPTHRLYEARGPTEQGLTATQVALPPPA